MIKLQYKLRNFCCAALLLVMSVFLAFNYTEGHQTVYADDANDDKTPHFVTIHNDDTEVTVKTTASTVADVLEKAGITVNNADIVEPTLETHIESEEFRVNVYRARPVLIMDGVNKRYVMTASYDPKQIMADAGLTLYDGDEIDTVTNDNFLETGVATAFRVKRNGGREITTEEIIPYTTEERLDPSLKKGERVLEQAGEDGRKLMTYKVNFENNREVSREFISEEIKAEPKPEIVRVGAKVSVAPGREQCAQWMRAAGVSEADLDAALYIVYHESGCRVDAANPSGAYGIPQALPGSKMASAGADWETNPVTQIRWMIGYVNGRYGGWSGAVAHKNAKGWY